jgi:hypothetical protein
MQRAESNRANAGPWKISSAKTVEPSTTQKHREKAMSEPITTTDLGVLAQLAKELEAAVDTFQKRYNECQLRLKTGKYMIVRIEDVPF